MIRTGKTAIGCLRCRRGVASIEFMMVMPIMILIMFASVELWSMISTRGRLTDATAVLADLVSSTPQTTIDSTEISYLLDAFDAMMGGNASETKVQVIVVGGNPDFCDSAQNPVICANIPVEDQTNDIIVKWIEAKNVQNTLLQCGKARSNSPSVINAFSKYFDFTTGRVDDGQDVVLVVASIDYKASLSSIINDVTFTQRSAASIRNLAGRLDGSGCP